MIEWFGSTLTGSLLISLCAYAFGDWLKRKTGKSWCNPLLIACICVVLFLIITGLPYTDYQAGTRLLTSLLTPSMVCLAIPLYKQIEVLKENVLAILAEDDCSSIRKSHSFHPLERLKTAAIVFVDTVIIDLPDTTRFPANP